jgi:hypothetical protein
VVFKTGDSFLHVADSDRSARGGLKGAAARKVEVYAVFEVDPFVVSEKVTKCGVTVGDL